MTMQNHGNFEDADGVKLLLMMIMLTIILVIMLMTIDIRWRNMKMLGMSQGTKIAPPNPVR